MVGFCGLFEFPGPAIRKCWFIWPVNNRIRIRINNEHLTFISINNVSGTVLCVLHTLHTLFLKTTPWGRYYDYPCSPDEGAGAGRSISLTKLTWLLGEECMNAGRLCSLATLESTTHAAFLVLCFVLFCFDLVVFTFIFFT